MLFQCDVKLYTQMFNDKYKYHLVSDDVFENDLPLIQSRSHGGCLVFWKKELDPFITVYHSFTSRGVTPVVEV